MRTDSRATDDERAEVEHWVISEGYTDLAEWLRDSDYLYTDNDGWVDLDDNPVDPYAVAYYAREAAEGL